MAAFSGRSFAGDPVFRSLVFYLSKVKRLVAPECGVEIHEFCLHAMLEQESLRVKVKSESLLGGCPHDLISKTSL